MTHRIDTAMPQLNEVCGDTSPSINTATCSGGVGRSPRIPGSPSHLLRHRYRRFATLHHRKIGLGVEKTPLRQQQP
jgi:hypothetical protein